MLRLAASILVVCILASCASETAPRRLKGGREPYLNYVVQRDGENLATISRRYTGSASNWKELLKYNPNLNAYDLRAGETVHIPAHLMTTDPQAVPPRRSKSRGDEHPAKDAETKRPTPAPTAAPTPVQVEPPAQTEQRKQLRDKLLDEILKEEAQ